MSDIDLTTYNPDNVDDYSKKQLAKLVFTGVITREQVDEDGLFRPNRKLLDEELALMSQEDRDWTKATQENTSESYQRYLTKYNPTITDDSVLDGWGETVYIGRHVEDAKRLKTLVDAKKRDTVNLQDDEADWKSVSEINTIDSYGWYVHKYDVQPPLYRGKYVDEAKLRINRLNDAVAWKTAKKINTKKSYSDYLAIYDRQAPEYVGNHVEEATLFVNQIQDEEDWRAACSDNTIPSYESYLSKYDKLPPHYQGRYVAKAKETIVSLTEPEDPLKYEEQDWVEAREANTVDSYSSFINTYSPLGGKHVQEAKTRKANLQEEADWNRVKQENTVQSYRNYLSTYQNKKGRHVQEALDAIKALKPNPLKDEMEDWANAMRKDSIEGYKAYLSKYEPLNGQYVQKAKMTLQRLLDETAWKEAIAEATIASYQSYLAKFENINGAHVKEAKLRINQLKDDAAWMQASDTDTVQAYQGYLKQYDVTPPAYRGRYIEDARKRIASAFANQDNKDWLKATQANTIDAYQRYLNKYENANPQGKHIAEAKHHIMSLKDEETWAKACKLNTKEAYEAYIRDFTKNDYRGKHLAEAKRKLRPIHWSRLIWLIVIAALGWFLWIQWVDGGWPFNIFQGREETPIEEEIYVEEMSPLEIAINNHDLTLLDSIVQSDGCSAYLPYACELWAQRKDTLNSLKYARLSKECPSDPSRPLRNEEADSLIYEIKDALDYDGTIGHVAPPIPANIEDRLPILVKENRIMLRARYISDKFGFPYTENKTILKYIEDDFNRWVKYGDATSIPSTKIDAYKAALQLRENAEVRSKLESAVTINNSK